MDTATNKLVEQCLSILPQVEAFDNVCEGCRQRRIFKNTYEYKSGLQVPLLGRKRRTFRQFPAPSLSTYLPRNQKIFLPIHWPIRRGRSCPRILRSVRE